MKYSSFIVRKMTNILEILLMSRQKFLQNTLPRCVSHFYIYNNKACEDRFIDLTCWLV